MANTTIRELLTTGAAQAPALAAPGREPMTFGDLRGVVARTTASLHRLDIGRRDTVAIVLPNGPEMASAFVAIGAAATTAPLNPAYREQELDFYLTDLGARLLIVEASSDSPARRVATDKSIPVAELRVADGARAGAFELSALGLDTPTRRHQAVIDTDNALVLHTSGTTSRPKMVPLSQKSLCASAAHIATSLALEPADRCLNIMPLFHIHGLMAAVLASLSVGASVFCTPGFNALRFFAWLDESQPSWYTAVPTMHQTILERAPRNPDTVAASALRFVRSSSASLPPQVMGRLEETFRAPVIEAYGMTEASHQMTSNPLPPREQKPGSVGIAAGPDVAVMDTAGRLLEAGSIGEVVIRGPNVCSGYLNNPEANASAFTDGWFRTGDEGRLDHDGYLFLTGRLKEIINRGGEKISPREVDEVLLDHPAVRQAVTFALPHDKLGEEVAAAVVLAEGLTATESDLRGYVRDRLALFKVPKTVLFVDEIPKGPTGKLQRIGLARQLGLV